jgi:hypothetical protein
VDASLHPPIEHVPLQVNRITITGDLDNIIEELRESHKEKSQPFHLNDLM